MTLWLERREKVQQHAAIIQGRLKATHNLNTLSVPPKPTGPPGLGTHSLKMTQNPTRRRVYFEELAHNYGAMYFQDALGNFIAKVNHPAASTETLDNQARNTLIPFHWVSVFHKIKFICSDTNESNVVDAIHVRPGQTDSEGHTIPPHFDTVLVHGKQDNIHRVNGKHLFY